ncbi:MAG: bifunctional tetrahydrofolate synthase/dihydrofolate synthase [Piscirickettsiaceae bacterium]|nr:MAG: bifunctional tetrahydrofolate synthase/dihydrofolate synthase [Piscirickettsiaceae bacterium]PCI72374.1 MAG: bifunctional tetrahydrofolate synthase/dihydrofolate synthase [Piscirickettsiaceae bacterium]
MPELSGLSASSSLSDWLSWQETSHTRNVDLGLTRVSTVYNNLANKKDGKFTITVAGTNGKGSSVAMLEAILLAAGYSVGVYSTPHLKFYNERIRLNGVPVDDAVITASFARIDQARLKTSLSYFEFGTLAALDIFHQNIVDVQILEVGLGGRLDAVNIIDAEAALITRIGIDHVDWLGDDIATIAFEKAGIFRALQKAVCGDKRVPQSLIGHAQSLRTDLLLAGTDFDVKISESSWQLIAAHNLSGTYPLPALKGQHQIDNAAAVVMLLAHVAPALTVTREHINDGLLNLALLGRTQWLPGQPSVLLDVAHNPQSAQALAGYLKELNHAGEVHAVFSILADKDVEGTLLPFKEIISKWYVAPIESSRAKSTMDIELALSHHSMSSYDVYPTIGLALNAAKEQSLAEDLIVCFGSFYVVDACLETL